MVQIRQKKYTYNHRSGKYIQWYYVKLFTLNINLQEDQDVSIATEGHLVVTSCSEDHKRNSLSCKMQREFDIFFRSKEKKYINLNSVICI